MGENGFKPGADGSYFNALDNPNDTFKFVEDAINNSKVNTDEKKYIKIGLNFDADSSFLKE